MKATNGWRPIKTYNRPDGTEVDLWLHIYASPRSMGFSDSFRVTDAYRIDKRWLHRQDGEEKEIYADYVTHWMPVPKPPKQEK